MPPPVASGTAREAAADRALAPAPTAGPAPCPLIRDLGAWLLAFNVLLLVVSAAWMPLRIMDRADTALLSDLAFIAFMLSLALMTWRAAGTTGLPTRARTGWRLITLGSIAYLMGNAVWFYYEVIRGVETPFPSLADLGYVAFYPPILAGIAYFIRPMENPVEQRLFWLDLGVIALGAGTLVWYFLLWPIARSEHDSTLALVLAEAYPLSATVLLVGAVALLLKPWADRSTAPIPWLTAGLFSYFVADMRYGVETTAMTYASGGVTDQFYHLSAVLMMVSALLEYRDGPDSSPAGAGPGPGERLLAVLPYAAVAAVYGLLLSVAFGWHWGLPGGRGGEGLGGLALAAATAAALAMARQTIAAREIARLSAEQLIRKSEARFASLARHSSDLIGLLGADRRLRFVSPSVQRVLGIAPQDLVGRPLDDLIHPDDRPAGARFMARVRDRDGSTAPTEWRVRHADGSWRIIEVLATNLIDDPAVAGVVINGRDITERSEFERRLQEARLAAEAASRAKTDFLALVSHELRTPLNAVLGLAQVLESGPLSSQQLDLVGRIRGAGRALLAIINDILDLSRIETGRLRVESGGYELGHLLAEIDRRMGESARDKGLAWRMEAPTGPLGPLLGDRQRLAQVLLNLVGNAIKFTAQGEVVLRVAVHQDPGRNAGWDQAPRLHFAVRDTGIGIPPETLGRLFIPFTQADEGITRRFGGTGLGLALCKRLVELMGGEIGVESVPGQGSTFWFEVPLVSATAEVLEAASPDGSAPTGPQPPLSGGTAPAADPLAPPATPVATAEPLADRLAALRGALRHNDLKALPLVEGLLPVLKDSLGPTAAEALRGAVRGLRFEEALALLDQRGAASGKSN